MLPINDVRSHYIGTGSLAVYPFDFKIKSAEELLVIVTDASGNEYQRVRGDDVTYLSSLEFDSIEGGGEVTLLASLPSDYEIYLILAPDEPIQDNSFRNRFDFTLKRIEAAFDQVTAYVQRLAYIAKYVIRLHDLDEPDDFDPMLPQGVSSNTDDLIPHVTAGGWAPISQWTPLADLAAAVAAAIAAAASATTAATQAASSAASAAASAASALISANVTPVVVGSRAVPYNVAAAAGIPFTGTAWFNTWYIQGDGGPVNISINPQIAPGTNVGQKLRLMACSDANSVTFEDLTGLDTNGTLVMVDKSIADLEWDGLVWCEAGRR